MLYTYFYFVNSLLTDIQNVDIIAITIIKVKIVSRLRRKTCDIFYQKPINRLLVLTGEKVSNSKQVTSKRQTCY